MLSEIEILNLIGNWEGPKRVVAGIDIGQDGGIAFYIKSENKSLMFALPMPVIGTSTKEIDIFNLRVYFDDVIKSNVSLVVIEKVTSMPKQGVASTFKFGTSYGEIRGALKWSKIPYQLVTPQAWKKVILVGTNKDKDAAIAHVKTRWPEVNLLKTDRSRKAHDGMADAVCLAEYADYLLSK